MKWSEIDFSELTMTEKRGGGTKITPSLRFQIPSGRVLYDGISYNMNNTSLRGILHSRGGFITRTKRPGLTKVVKKRTTISMKKRGHKKTQNGGSLELVCLVVLH